MHLNHRKVEAQFPLSPDINITCLKYKGGLEKLNLLRPSKWSMDSRKAVGIEPKEVLPLYAFTMLAKWVVIKDRETQARCERRSELTLGSYLTLQDNPISDVI